MDRLIYTAMTGAKHAFLQQAGVAQNLANASTTGYRAMEHRFRAVPVQGDGVSTRAFVVDASVVDAFDQGPLMATGRPLDVAVQGAGWLTVETADGREAYTRAGNLQVNANGQLQTASGMNVLCEGGPIAIPPDNRWRSRVAPGYPSERNHRGCRPRSRRATERSENRRR